MVNRMRTEVLENDNIALKNNAEASYLKMLEAQ
jgi:hypothetical protein